MPGHLQLRTGEIIPRRVHDTRLIASQQAAQHDPKAQDNNKRGIRLVEPIPAFIALPMLV
jgi:hypothetical protein